MSRYEQPAYTVVARGAGYEIRDYDAHIVAETTVEGDFQSTGTPAFRRLAGFIFGRNSENRKMNMTVPVTLQPLGQGHHRYRFMMERAYSIETLPQPLDGAVRLVSIPAGRYAARRYRGGRREQLFRRVSHRLVRALERDGIEATGPAELAVYSGPITPPFLKRNEVLIPVAAG